MALASFPYDIIKFFIAFPARQYFWVSGILAEGASASANQTFRIYSASGNEEPGRCG